MEKESNRISFEYDGLEFTEEQLPEAKLLRVEEIQYTTTTDTFTLIEDEGTI